MTKIAAYVMLVTSLCAPQAWGQTRDTATAHPPEPFFTSRDIWRAGGFVVGIAVASRFDKTLAHDFRNPANQENATLHNAAAFFKFMGQPAPQIIGPVLYVTGRLTHQRRIAALGLHGVEAMVLSTVLTGVPKIMIGRARPYVVGDTLPDSYGFMRGLKGRDYQSFPSGHATTAFAVASSVTAEAVEWARESHWFHGSSELVGVTMYGGATLIALSRMYHNEHWASDVVAAAAVGTFSGIKVVRYAYRHPNNRVERWLLSTQVVPDGSGGVYLGISVPTGKAQHVDSAN